jgi:predicted acyl esterase
MAKNWRQLISQPKYNIKTERELMVPMRDGVKLSVNVFRPDVRGKFPALLAMGGYGKELQELLIAPQPLFKSAVWDGNIEAGDTPNIVPRGYVHVIGDVRGVGTSEGEYSGMWSTQEGKDGHDVVEWIAKQPWCDGNVGMIGYSYYGGIQLMTAIQQPPHLKTIFVSHVGADNYRDFVYMGGIFSLFFYGLWDGRHGTSGFAPRNAPSLMKKKLSKKEFESRVQELLDDPDIQHYPNLYHLLHYPQKNPWCFDQLLNPYDGPFWRDRSVYPFYNKIKIPVYVVGKVAHEASGFWDVYTNINVPKMLLVKPNEPEERPWREDLDVMLRWYDHWLKGNDTGMLKEPPVKIYMTGTNQWRYEKKWPLAGADWTKFYLRRWEGMLMEPELYQAEPDCFLQQPLHVSTKRDSVKYVSPPVPEDVEVLGPSALNIFASIDQDDAHWIVKVYDVAPGGAESRVTKGYLKASHRALDARKSKPYAPYHPHTRESVEKINPGEIYEYNIALGIITHVFKTGHRVKVTIESLESPRDPEMQIHYHPRLNSSKTTLHKIYRDREHQSHLMLPIIGKKPSVVEQLSDDNFL